MLKQPTENNLSLGVLICLDMVSIKSLDLGMFLKSVFTVEKFLTISKSFSWQILINIEKSQ